MLWKNDTAAVGREDWCWPLDPHWSEVGQCLPPCHFHCQYEIDFFAVDEQRADFEECDDDGDDGVFVDMVAADAAVADAAVAAAEIAEAEYDTVTGAADDGDDDVVEPPHVVFLLPCRENQDKPHHLIPQQHYDLVRLLVGGKEAQQQRKITKECEILQPAAPPSYLPM